MALQSAGGFATFNITDGAQIRDISPLLADAIYYDLHLLGNMNVDFGTPATDIQHWWNEDLLNADQALLFGTNTASITTSETNLIVNTATAAADLALFHVGDLLTTKGTGSQEVMQITAISTPSLTVSRAFASTANSGAATSYGASTTFSAIRGEQEGSDIGSDKSLSPTVLSNYTQILAGAFDVKVTGSQLARQMATAQMQDYVARQLSNRAIELKIGLSRALLYSRKSGPGSGTAYRYMGGLQDWIANGNGTLLGVQDTVSAAFSYSYVNTQNKSIVDKGVFPDTLVIGTDLVGSVTGYDSTNRRLLESDRVAGYTINQVVLNQGNTVNVVVDSRVRTGDAFLLSSERIRLIPLQGRGMFVIAAVDFTDAKKRRVLAEWTSEVRNPQAHGYFANKT